jgi:hypothetical protein
VLRGVNDTHSLYSSLLWLGFNSRMRRRNVKHTDVSHKSEHLVKCLPPSANVYSDIYSGLTFTPLALTTSKCTPVNVDNAGVVEYTCRHMPVFQQPNKRLLIISSVYCRIWIDRISHLDGFLKSRLIGLIVRR